MTLRESILLSFLGAAIFLYKLVVHIELRVPGNSGMVWMSFMVLGRLAVGKAGSATLVGTVAGLLAALTGQSKEGPLVFVKYLFPGLTLDLLYVLEEGLLGRFSRLATVLSLRCLEEEFSKPNGAAGDVEFRTPGEASIPDLLRVKVPGVIPGARAALVLTAGVFSGMAHLTKLGGSYLAGVLLGVPRNFLLLGLGYSAITHFTFGVIGGVIGALVYGRLTRTKLVGRMYG
ncbi:MAG TPA: hypothetical protein GXX30_04545 [Firmicutes bacterium]|nr:hypothetical protein [Candidatus Fermentithermobacillaceae bacterium]